MSNEMAAGLRSRTVKTIEWEAPTGDVFTARIPSSAQMMIFLSSMDGGSMSERWGAVKNFLSRVLKEEGEFEQFYELIEEGEIDLPDIMGDSEEGEEDRSLLGRLTEAVSGGRPTPQSDASSDSSRSAGKRSTGRSRGKGSIPSTSRSTAS